MKHFFKSAKITSEEKGDTLRSLFEPKKKEKEEESYEKCIHKNSVMDCNDEECEYHKRDESLQRAERTCACRDNAKFGKCNHDESLKEGSHNDPRFSPIERDYYKGEQIIGTVISEEERLWRSDLLDYLEQEYKMFPIRYSGKDSKTVEALRKKYVD